MLNAGIYAIINKINIKRYIGSSIDLTNRRKNHVIMLKNNKHYNRFLQSAYNKYGGENFTFEVLEYVFDISKIYEREQYHINQNFSYVREFGYNLSPAAGCPAGVKHTDEFKAKISAIHKGKKHSKEWIDKIAKALTGKKASDIARANISKALKGRKLSNNHVEKLILYKRDFIKWPCPEGSECKCQDCRDKRAEYMRLRRMAQIKENSNG